MSEAQRDIERAEEYEATTARASILSENRFELSTGLIIAARYADKLRRVALVALGKMVPKDVIIRDVSEFNKSLYDVIVNQMKIDKLDVIKLIVSVKYDKSENKLIFEDYKIIRYYTEEECRKQYESVIQENEKLKKEINDIRKKLSDLLGSFQ